MSFCQRLPRTLLCALNVSLALLLSPIAGIAAEVPSPECAHAVYQIKNLSLYADGSLSRSVHELRPGKKSEEPRYFKIERDRILLEEGDDILLNVDINAVDAAFHVRIQLLEKDKDAVGVLSSLYAVTEYNTSLFSGTPIVQEKSYRVKLVSDYATGSSFIRSGCGEVLVMDESND
jgi:hypothetical protein